MDISKICEQYLRNITPTAQRMAEDIERIKKSHRTTWENINSKDRDRLVDKEIIDSKVAVQYAQVTEAGEWQCESLSNFSWFTKSQLNLFTYIDVQPTFVMSPLKRSEVVSPKVHRDTVDKVVKPHVKIKSKLAKSPSSDEPKAKMHPSKPKTPPPPPPSKLIASDKPVFFEDPNQDDIPKTGFDFLDNW